MTDDLLIGNDTVTRFYGARLKQYGIGPEAVGWPNKEKQRLRFRALCQIAPLAGSSVLDVGCGLGDLHDELPESDYRGIDICADLIAAAKQRRPETAFRVVDLLRDSYNETADYLMASGLFGLNLGDNDRFRTAMLSRMWALCRKGMAVNFVSTHVDYQESYLAYTDPQAMFAFCMKQLTPRVVLRHDYLYNDFTVYLYKEEPERR